MAELQIRSQALRRAIASPLSDRMLGFGLLPDTTAKESSMGEDKAWRQTDLTRAIRAAEKACLRGYRIEIATDGTIAIVVGAADTVAARCVRAELADRTAVS